MGYKIHARTIFRNDSHMKKIVILITIISLTSCRLIEKNRDNSGLYYQFELG